VFGKREVSSAYAETVVPLVDAERGIPLVNSLELTASARFEKYSDFGETTKPKVGVNWRPTSWLMVRGSYNEGFMAPSLAALNTSPRWSITAGAGDLDAYRNPYLNEGPYVKRTYFGGNPDLKPQESEGTTYGIAQFAPVACAGPLLSAEIDAISKALAAPARPLAAIVAGSKVSTKLTILQSLAKNVDQLIVGGGRNAAPRRALSGAAPQQLRRARSELRQQHPRPEPEAQAADAQGGNEPGPVMAGGAHVQAPQQQGGGQVGGNDAGGQ
jgi:hypothetical protein